MMGTVLASSDSELVSDSELELEDVAPESFEESDPIVISSFSSSDLSFCSLFVGRKSESKGARWFKPLFVSTVAII